MLVTAVSTVSAAVVIFVAAALAVVPSAPTDETKTTDARMPLATS